jgi:hypothetical protein
VSPIHVPPPAGVLVEHLGAGRPLPAELRDLEAWLEASPRLRTFVDANRDKIRKKLRLATTPDTRLDLRAELRVAARLLSDRRFELMFEAYGSGNRGPDFTVTFRATRAFNVEVTRRHGGSPEGLERTVLGKLRQLPPGNANVLVVGLDAVTAGTPDLDALMRGLRAHADRRDDSWFGARGVADTATFIQGQLRLAAVIAWAENADASSRAIGWVNPGARIPADSSALRAVIAALHEG